MSAYRIKNVAEINKKTLPDDTDPDFTFKYIDISSVGSDGKITMPNETIKFSSAPSRARRLAPEGSVIVSTVRTYLQAITTVPRSDEPLVFSTGFAILEATSRVNKRFLGYHCRSQDFLDDVAARSTGVSYPAINPSEIGDLPIILPPLEEQRRIADFLDAETARIDRLLLARQRQLALLRMSLDSLAMKQTGRSVIHDESLPPTWLSVQLRRVISTIKTGTTPSTSGADYWEAQKTDQSVPWFGPSSAETRLKAGDPVKWIHRTAITRGVVPLFPAGSTLIVGIGATAGKVFFAPYDATGNQQITAIKACDSAASDRFLAWQLWAAEKEMRELAPYTTLPIINNSFLKSFRVALPELGRQIRIVATLDERSAALDVFEEKSNELAGKLAERRQALITAAVTGQFDVSTASGRGVTE